MIKLCHLWFCDFMLSQFDGKWLNPGIKYLRKIVNLQYFPC